MVNQYAAKWTVSGWFIGLAYYNWFATHPDHVAFWAHAVLVIGGLFAAPLAIGGGMAFVAAGVTKLVLGNALASGDFYAWAAFISPVLAFFASGAALRSLG